jgi:hypothetical protein
MMIIYIILTRVIGIESGESGAIFGIREHF